MKLKTIPLIFAAILLLCSCNNTQPNTTSNDVVTETTTIVVDDKEETTAIMVDDKEELPASIPGIYLGKNGSGLVIYDNGTADYYWHTFDEVEKGDKWNYTDNRLTIFLPSCSCDVYFDINDETDSELVIKSDSANWDDEIYVKISSVQSAMTPEEFDNLLVQNGILEPEINYTDIEIGKIFFPFPEDYIYEKETNGTYLIVSKTLLEKSEGIDYTAVIMATQEENATISAEKFEARIDNVIEEFLGEQIFSNSTLIDKQELKVAGQQATRYIYKYYNNENHIIMDITLINNSSDSYIDMLFFIESYKNEEDKNILDVYYQDYVYAIENAHRTATTEIDNAANNVDTTTTTGVTPELKAFLDEYEAFTDKYVDFMKKYYSNSSADALSMLADYTEIMTQYAEFAEKIDAYDEETMSSEDLKYYTEVVSRCTVKMASIY